MPGLSVLLEHWGYAAIFVVVIVGNLGVPVPEETVLGLAGYLVWRGELRLPIVLAVGVLSAVAGDNLGYWLGRDVGRDAIERYGRRVYITPERLRGVSGLVARYGAIAVFGARFVPGLRVLAGPVAGATGIRPWTFALANLLGALPYVPYAVGVGYAVGYGLGDSIEHLVGRVEWLVLAAGALLTVVFVGCRIRRARHATG